MSSCICPKRSTATWPGRPVLTVARTGDDDPVGWLQLSSRKADLERELTRLEAAPETRAAVALFFGRRPVLGSKGIAANFAGKAIDCYQDLLAKHYAALESGPLGDRGPVPLHPNAPILNNVRADG